ncbi:MAG: molecular chaperone DnaJ, partial [Thermodesulfobacteriota bacterium]
SSRPGKPGPGPDPAAGNGNGNGRAAGQTGGNGRPRDQEAAAGQGRSETGAAGGWTLDGRYQGPLPQRELLFGHFLYYSGAISWRSMIQALVWQRMQRPRIGEIARRLGWLSDGDVQSIFRQRRIFERFGGIAQRVGLLTDFQVRVLLLHQRRLQRRLGDYFVEQSLLSEHDVERLHEGLRLHNASMRRERSASASTH